MLAAVASVMLPVLSAWPSVRPVRVLAQLKLLVKSLLKLAPLMGSMVNAPLPVKPNVVGAVLFLKISWLPTAPVSVLPVYVCTPVSVSVLSPLCCKPPVPVMAWAMLTSSERLKAKVPLTDTAPVPNEPVVPALPTCKVPALMVVVV